MSVRVDPEQVFAPSWPPGLQSRNQYRVACDDKGRNGGSFLQVLIAEDGDVHVSAQEWEGFPEGNPSPFPSVRIRTMAGGGRNMRTRQALLWLAEAIRLDTEEQRAREEKYRKFSAPPPAPPGPEEP